MGKKRKTQEKAKISVNCSKLRQKNGANARNRTEDLFITSEPLYRLSYVGIRLCNNIAWDPVKIKAENYFFTDIPHLSPQNNT